MQVFFQEKHYLCPRIDRMFAYKLTRMRQKPLLLTLCLLLAGVLSLLAQEIVIVGPQVTQESDLVEGQPYILQSQASGTPYVVDADTYYFLPNSANKATEACVYRFISNGEGAWTIQSTYTEKCWSAPAYNQAITPVPLEEAGAWKLNFKGGIAYPTALDAEGTEWGLDRSSQKLWGYTPGTGGTKQIKIFNPIFTKDLGEEIALVPELMSVKRGYQTTGCGNKNALLLRIDINPLKAMSDVKFTFALDATTIANIAELYLYETSATEFLANIPAKPIASTADIAGTLTLSVGNSSNAAHHYWLCATVKEDAVLGAILKAALTRIDYTTTQEVELDVTTIGNPERQGMKVFALQNFVFISTTNDCRYYRIPAMILDKNGNLVVAIDKRYGSNADLGNHKIDVVSLRSEDGGVTWKQQASVATGDGSSAAYYGYGDAAMARAANGTLICVMAAGSKRWGSNKDAGMMYAGLAKSSTNGRSWSLTKNLFAANKFYDEVHGTKGSIGFSNIFVTSGKGLTTNDGVIMFAANCTEMGTTSPALCHILYSTDNGSNWRLSKALAYSGCDESKLEQLNDGSLLLSVRQSGNRGWNKATYTKNDDGTVTFNWGEQFRNNNIWGNACNADILYYSRQSATTPDILLHTYINTGGRESLQLSMSLDGGTSWKDVYNIQPNGSCYSTMQALPDGTLAILFEDDSYNGGNGYAINYVTLTKEQILDMFTAIGGVLPVGVETLMPTPSSRGETGVFNLKGQRISRPQRGVNIIDGKKVVL